MKLQTKRILCLLLTLVLALSAVPAPAFASEADEALSNFEYTVDSDTQTITLSKYIGSDAAVVVEYSYTVDGVAYATVLDSSSVFRYNSAITSVTIGSGVAFKDNSMAYLFSECKKLVSVDMTGVDTSEITSMAYLFDWCNKLTTITGYENWNTGKVENIYKAFNRNNSISTVDLSGWDLSSVVNSGWCFQQCYATEIKLPDNLKTISAGFLNHASKVTGTTFTIPAGVEKIGYAHTIYDFATDDFVEFIVAEGNERYAAIDGILYSTDGTEMLAVPRNKTFENNTYEIPEGVTFLGELSFSRNYNIHTLVLPDSYIIEYVPLYDDAYIVFEDIGNLNAGTNLSIAIYCYTGITEYAVKDSNPNYTSQNGIIYSKDMTEVVAIPARYAQEMVIPEGVTTWNMEAMWADTDNNSSSTLIKLMANCPGVSIPVSLTSISEDQLSMLNLLYTSRKGTSNPFTITIAEGNTSFELDENEGLIVKPHEHTYENGTCTGCGDHIGPTITKQPESVQVPLGEKFSITVEAEGEDLTYQWYYKHKNSDTFAKSSFQSNAYAMTMATYCHNREIYCVITDAYGNSIQTETVLITAPLSITKQPTDVQVEIGQSFSVSVSALGDDLVYQWYYKNSGDKAFAVSSFTGKSYSMTMREYCHNRQVYCVITDAYGNTVTTDTVIITRPPVELKILEQPADVQVEIGQRAEITVKVQGEGLTYQWYYKNAGGKSFAKSSYNGNTYAMVMREFCHNRQVYCVITDKYGNSVTTEIATMSRPPVELEILEQPADAYAVRGERFSIHFTVQGEGLSYQWYYKDTGMKEFKISSNTGSAYSYKTSSYHNGRQVYCVITDQYGSQVTTDTATIYVTE